MTLPLQHPARLASNGAVDAKPMRAGRADVACVPTAVLDTNVFLDWLVFRNPGVHPLVQAVEQGAVRWLASQDMQDELMHVLGRGTLQAWRPEAEALRQAWADWATILPAAPALPGHMGLRCRDADDQKFVDLAVHSRARWLVSRDRAVLALSRRARLVGLTICTPEHWPGAASLA